MAVTTLCSHGHNMKTVLEMEAIQSRGSGRGENRFRTYFWITVVLGIVAPMLLGAGTAL
jgi:hypothetical protein